MVGNAYQASDAHGAVDQELARLLGGTRNFTLEYRINEADRIVKIVEEVPDTSADRSRDNRRVSVRQGAYCMDVELVIEAED